MRDPDRIEAILVALRLLWTKYPDQRLGQLVSNVCPKNQDLFHVEDDEWLARMLDILDAE